MSKLLSQSVLGVLTTLALSSATDAAVYYYPDMTATYGQASSVTLDVATGKYTDPNTQLVTGPTRYYGGTLDSDVQGVWDQSVALRLNRATGNAVRIEGGAAEANWRMNLGPVGSGVAVGDTVNFVIKVSDAGWDHQSYSVFFGANAMAATEGTPDGTWSGARLNNASESIDTIELFMEGGTWNTGRTVTATNLFSADVWATQPPINGRFS